MWSIEITAERRTFLTYRPILGNEVTGDAIRVIELHDGPPSLNDITHMQNYLQSYKGLPLKH